VLDYATEEMFVVDHGMSISRDWPSEPSNLICSCAVSEMRDVSHGMRNLGYSCTTDVIQYASWSVLLQRMLSEGDSMSVVSR
jgi:hypothetical protein